MPKRGFTLIELLVVIAIIGILAGIIVPNLNSAKQSGRDAKRISDLKNIQLALALYYGDQISPHYPLTLNDLVTGGYLSSTALVDPSGNNYVYSALTSKTGPSSQNCINPNVIIYYHLGAKLDGSNTDGSGLLSDANGDADWPAPSTTACNGSSPSFAGRTVGCVGVPNASQGDSETCYDVVPN
jgi:prepilin-type N-terminal cleavage/methylation domain-containing protein